MNEQIEKTILEVLTIPDDKAGMLKLMINKIMTDVKAYINRPIPDELQPAIVMKLVAYIEESGVFLTDEERQAKAPVSSISEGDTSVSYAVKQKAMDMIAVADFLDTEFRRTLQHYRVLTWSGN